MTLSFVCFLFLFLSIYKTGIFATTIVHFFADSSCQDASFTVWTDNQAHDGPCGQLGGINGSRTVYVDSGCGGMASLRSST